MNCLVENTKWPAHRLDAIMANMNTLAPHVSGSTFGQVIIDTIADLRDRRAQRAVYRRVYNELSAMGPRELADIGISRNNIAEIAKQSAYGL
jgi:uncharacterized protein YjiS (DUF1127 family)